MLSTSSGLAPVNLIKNVLDILIVIGTSSGRKINVEFEKELVDTVAIDDLSQLLTLEDTTYENLLAGLAELGKEITQDTQYNLYQDKDSIRYLLKACLALNKRQLDSLRQCSIQEFGIRRRIIRGFFAECNCILYGTGYLI